MSIPLAVYIHLPWCITKCPYCDFTSHQIDQQAAGRLDIAGYARALESEWLQRLPLVAGREIVSVYCGGGTPNLFPPEFYARLFGLLRQHVRLANSCEITLEANPGKGRLHDYKAYKQAGFTRLSLGVQSLHPATLAALGRDYSPEQAHQAVTAALASGIANINLDAMFATPGQTLRTMEHDLNQLLAYRPQHLSHYELTLEPNTSFYSNPPAGLPDDDTRADMYELAGNLLAAAGLKRYEVSAYAAAGFQCRHNRNYWEFGDYLGLGTGAHGKITLPNTGQLLRYANPRLPKTYIRAISHTQPKPQQQDLFMQYCLNAFRLCQGTMLDEAAQRLLTPLAQVRAQLAPLLVRGYLCQASFAQGRIRLTDRAFLHQSQVLSGLV